MTYFNPNVKWLNNFLLGEEADVKECIQDCSKDLHVEGKLFVGFADPTSDSIQSILRINEDTSIQMLHFLMKLKKTLKEDPYNVDYLIIDCNPGTGFSTVNAMVVTDVILFVVKLNNADLIGTTQMINGLKKQLKSNTLVVANQIPEKFYTNSETKNGIKSLLEKNFTDDSGKRNIDFLGWLPSDLNMIDEEFEIALEMLKNNRKDRIIHSRSYPKHPITKTIEKLNEFIFGIKKS